MFHNRILVCREFYFLIGLYRVAARDSCLVVFALTNGSIGGGFFVVFVPCLWAPGGGVPRFLAGRALVVVLCFSVDP